MATGLMVSIAFNAVILRMGFLQNRPTVNFEWAPRVRCVVIGHFGFFDFQPLGGEVQQGISAAGRVLSRLVVAVCFGIDCPWPTMPRPRSAYGSRQQATSPGRGRS